MREALTAYHALAEGNCHIDVSFHLIISDPTASVLGQELPAFVEDGYTLFKVFMTYEGLALTDKELLEVFACARDTGALAMVHAENYDAIGVETRLPILFSEGVSKSRIDLNTFVALTATNHAKIYGLYPRKGTIAVGSDIAIWDPLRRMTISQSNQHGGADYTPYEGSR